MSQNTKLRPRGISTIHRMSIRGRIYQRTPFSIPDAITRAIERNRKEMMKLNQGLNSSEGEE